MRRRQSAEPAPFMRDWWPDTLKECGLKMRLLNRNAWGPEGLTNREWHVIRDVAEGLDVPVRGFENITKESAEKLLTAPHLQRGYGPPSPVAS